MSTKWPEDTTLQFVQEYKQHECLWNRKSESYKNKQAREMAYKKLEKAMNIPGFGVSEVKMKIKNLRSTYCQELKKIQDSKNAGCTSDNCYVPAVKWFKEMESFLQIKRKNELEYENEQKVEVILDEVEDEYYETPVLTFSNGHSTHIHEASNVRKWKSHLKDINIAVKELKELRNEINRENDNEFDIFGKYIATQLKKLPTEQALVAQDRIQSFLMQCRLHDIRQTNAFLHVQRSPVSSNATEESCDPVKLEIV